MNAPNQRYKSLEKQYTKSVQSLEKTDRRISNLRLAVFIAGAAAAITLYLKEWPILAGAALMGFAALFILLIVQHGRILERIKYTAALRDINADCLKRLEGNWIAFADTGKEFLDEAHSYSGDLDIFGQNSLFQWISTGKTFAGRRKFSALLEGEYGQKEDILARQEAAAELAPLLPWRQSFLAEAMLSAEEMRNPEEIVAWAQESSAAFRKPWAVTALRVGPIITLTLIILGFVFNVIPGLLPAAALAIQLGLLAYRRKERSRMFYIAEKYSDDLRVYYKMLEVFEEQEFSSTLIKQIQGSLRNQADLSAHKQMNRLSSIVDSLANRRNMFYLVLNMIFMLDFQMIVALERWKQQSEKSLENWFDALGNMEVLSSLAHIRFDNPDWATPEICGVGPVFTARGMGHPLLTGRRVHNDLALDDEKKVLLITGSNMSGKSTLLRTAGVNLVLAYAGAPVCAASFQVSLMKISSCMRVSDNLGESISSFYAELLRIKEIVQEAESGSMVFFLLDEVFKGTNSVDRHTGAKVLVNKLSRTNSIGLVSTHDLELCELERENPKVANYHFQEYYTDGKLSFDYQLRPGPSTTRNALYLMRLAGIEV